MANRQTPLSHERQTPTAHDRQRRLKVTETARTRLQESSYSILRRVSCEFDQDCGVITLRGQLPSFFHKQLAQEALLNIQDVIRVNNEIEVTSSVA